ncbi:MAG: class II aldolase/adducin family protein, partial [Bdellovibrionales bacterium]|nr:class II aldolase/adducin family protein [Bdellovibrionales bacterium]
LKGVKAVFCEQHGVFVFGKSLVEAFFRLYLVCRAAEVIVQSSALTDQPKTALELAWPKEQAIEMFWKNMKEQVS